MPDGFVNRRERVFSFEDVLVSFSQIIADIGFADRHFVNVNQHALFVVFQRFDEFFDDLRRSDFVDREKHFR